MILVLNSGSSSIKFAVFDADIRQRMSGGIDGIGAAGGTLRLGETRAETGADTHTEALSEIMRALDEAGHPLDALRAVGHRVVHGGETLTAPARVTPGIRAEIEAAVPLAPLHNPHNLAGIDAIAELAPDLPQVACFDTGFHATNPEVARRYAIPDRDETAGIRRYGFHGISFDAMVATWRDQTGTDLPHRLLALHLGNGASLCAIREGESAATTMGYSPLEGLTMGTRSGSIDGNAVLHLAEVMGIEGARELLNHESGLLGLSGESSDMRALRASDSAAAAFAVEHFCYWAARHAGSMIAAMGGIDAMAFTGGIGENADPIRDRIVDLLRWSGDVPVHVIEAREEAQIARATADLLSGDA
ncbi:acetate/propionate family kinase [Roseovarius sp. SCSIO 43702]|uniref:acetate/propionate family kinase n=1 Tax=Roseovarius sp. SCSIO 43702 TaxID=2823043 RepID=UPI001C73DF4B|nr:acetate/propionate family kinase [Roseovarius sp. SCSIO 43702]QYX57496.1 acetate/propionate family kinase [Roseovarius sp. SCSIO 43702]